MKGRRSRFAALTTLSMVAVLGMAQSSSAQGTSFRRDMGKGTIEAPVKRMLRSSGDMPAPARNLSSMDLSKSAIEAPMKLLLKSDGAESVAPPAVSIVSIDEKTSPGLVSWRKDAIEAMARSSKSGKPVLVFHMMGSLDDRFC